MMITHGESVAGLIEAHLAANKKTQVALESETGLSDTSIARFRAGTLPGKWSLAPLASTLGIPLPDLQALVARERAARKRRAKRAAKMVGGRGHHVLSCPQRPKAAAV